MSNIRLNKYIAESGICSRREADKLIDDGKVKINSVVAQKGMLVDLEYDIVEVAGQVISKQDEKVYIMLNKPTGYVTTVKEQFNRPCVIDLIKEKNRVYPVGRLDMDTSGLLLLTNDGDFTNNITHPKHSIYKTYEVKLLNEITTKEKNMLEKGVDIGRYVTKEAKVKIINNRKIQIIISEGKNRQVRKMCEAVGRKVQALHRSKIGNIGVKDLKLGTWRYLKQNEINELLK